MKSRHDGALRPPGEGAALLAGAIPEFWLFLAQNCEVEVYRAPGADGYAQVTSLGGAAVVSPLSLPDVRFAVADFFA